MTAASQINELVLAINRVAIPVEAPGRVFVMPRGAVESTTRNFVVDAESEREILAALAGHGVQIPVDYDHATVELPRDGKAIAAGWVTALTFADDGVYADVEWTPAAARMIEEKEYRYLSPSVYVRKADSKAVGLHSIALTNKPAIRGMRPIVNSEAPEARKDDAMKDIVKALGLPDGADEAAAVTAINTLAANARKTPAAGDNVELVSLRAEVAAIRDNHKLTADALTSARAELQALRDNAALTAADERIALAIREGKLTDGLLANSANGNNFFRDLAKDEAKWNAWYAIQPVLAPPAGQRLAAPPAGGGSGADRASVIANSQREFMGKPEAAKLTTCRAWVSDDLRQRGMKTLTDDEAAKLAA